MQLNKRTDLAYQLFSKQYLSYSRVPNTFFFENFFYKGSIVNGTCTEWNSFVDTQLNLPYAYIEFQSMTAQFIHYDVATRSVTNISAVCSDENAASSIITSLREGRVKDITCNSMLWRVFYCNNQPVLCINCRRSCSDSSVRCPKSSMAVNPCTDCVQNVIYGVIVAVSYSSKVLYPQFQALSIYKTESNSLQIAANLTAPGNLYCAAFLAGYNVSSIIDIRLEGSSRLVIPPQRGLIVLGGLLPSTFYDIYCYSDDLSVNSMDWSMVLAHKLTAQTRCCKKVSFVRTFSYITQYSSTSSLASESQFGISLDFPITQITTVLLSISPCTGPSSSLPIITPAKFKFNIGESYNVRSFVVRGSAGCYIITASTNNVQYLNSTTRVNILSTIGSTVPPVFSKATFGNDGMTINMDFNMDTDRAVSNVGDANPFNCSRVVSFPGAPNAVCNWPSAATLRAILATSGVLPVPGDIVVLLARTVKRICTLPSCTNYPYASSTTKFLQAPSTPNQVMISLSSSQTVGPCDEILLDPTASTGQGGRQWADLKWTVSGTAPINAIQNISAYLNKNYRDTYSVVRVPVSMLTYEATYMVELKVMNFLMVTGAGRSPNILISSHRGTPSIRIGGPQQIFVKSSNLINLQVLTSLSSCSENFESSTSYVWKVWNGLNYMKEIQSSSKDPTRFVLDSSALVVNIQFAVQVVAYFSKSLQSSAAVLVTVVSDSIVPLIAGGTSQTITANNPMSFDASQSYSSNKNAVLTFYWTCFILSPNYGGSCRLDSNVATPILKLSANAIRNGSFSVTVYVYDSFGNMANQTCIVKVVTQTVPVVAVSTSSSVCNIHVNCLVSAQVVSQWKSPLQASWFASGSTTTILNLTQAALSPLKTVLVNNISVLSLALSPYSVIGGYFYTFALAVSQPNGIGAIASSGITIYINSPPFGGRFTVTPATGYSIETIYYMSSILWSDLELNFPLQFSFSYYTTTDNAAISIDYSGLISYTSAYLGQGFQSENYLVTCVSTVEDSLSGSANLTQKVAVFPISNLHQLWPQVQSNITLLLAQYKSASAQQIVSAVTDSLNNVNCTVLTPCKKLNRAPCSTVAHTCGACLTGYVGEGGDSNLPCVSTSILISRKAIYINSKERMSNVNQLAVGTSAFSLAGGYCAKNSSCLSQLCVSSQCVSPMNMCPNSCNGNGFCNYLDYNGYSKRSCPLADYHCSASCKCKNGWQGTDCSLSVNTSTFSASVLEGLSHYLALISIIRDTNANEMETRAAIISNILSVSQRLSMTVLENCTVVLQTSISENPGILYEGETYQPVSKALSLLFSYSKLSQAVSNSIFSMISTLVIASQSSVVQQGDQQTSLYTDSFRFSTCSSSISFLNTSLMIPQSSYSSFEHAPTIQILPDSRFYSSFDRLAISAIDLSFNFYGVQSNSSIVMVSYSLIQTGNVSKALKRKSYTITLNNIEPVHYVNTPLEHHIVNCTIPQLNPAVTTVQCKNFGTQYSIQCPKNTRGFIYIDCPRIKSLPTCELLTGDNHTTSSSCTTISFSKTSTVCKCYTDRGAIDVKLPSVVKTMLSVPVSSQQIVKSTYSITQIPMTSSFTAYANDVPISGNPVVLIMVGCLHATLLLMILVIGFSRRSKISKRKINPLSHYQGNARFRYISEFFQSLIPPELSGTSFLHVLRRQMLQSNELMYLFGNAARISDKSDNQYGLMLCLGFGKMLVYLFFSLLVGLVFIFNRGQCNASYSMSSCLSVVNLFTHQKECTWAEIDKSCKHDPLQVDTITALWLSVGSTIVAIVFNNVLEKLLHDFQNLFLRPKIKSAATILSMNDWDYDEFAAIQTTKTKLFLAARLNKIQQVVEFQSAEDEAEFLCQKTTNQSREMHSHSRVGVDGQVDLGQVRRQVQFSKFVGNLLQQQMSQLVGDEVKEKLLMKQFFINNCPLLVRSVVQYILFKQYEKFSIESLSLKSVSVLASAKILCILSLLALYSGFTGFIIYVGLNTSPDRLTEWAIVLAVSVVLGSAVIPVIHLILKWSAIFLAIRSCNLYEMVDWLRRRSKLVLIRSSGAMRNAHSMVQHLNPICRVARDHPYLQVARILISLSDNDLESHSSRLLSSFWSLNLFQFMWKTPLWLVDSLLDIFSLGLVHGVYYGFWLLFYSTSTSIFYASVAALLIIVFVILALLSIVKTSEISKSSAYDSSHSEEKLEHFDQEFLYHNGSVASDLSSDSDMFPNFVIAQPTANRYAVQSEWDLVQRRKQSIHGDHSDHVISSERLGSARIDAASPIDRYTELFDTAESYRYSSVSPSFKFDAKSRDVTSLFNKNITTDDNRLGTTNIIVSDTATINAPSIDDNNSLQKLMVTQADHAVGIKRARDNKQVGLDLSGLISPPRSSPGGVISKRKSTRYGDRFLPNGPGAISSQINLMQEASTYSSILVVGSEGPLPMIDFFANVDNVNTQLLKSGPGGGKG